MASNNLIENGNVWNAKGHIIAGRTGLLAAGGILANSIVAAIRNIGPQELVVTAVEQHFVTTTLATAGTSVGFGFVKVSGFTALANTAARATPPAPVRKRNADHQLLHPSSAAALAVNAPTPDTLVQVQVSATAPLSGATIAPTPLFDDPLGVLICCGRQQADAAAAFEGQSFWQPRSGIPLTLGNDEGLVFFALDALPAALVGRFGIGVEVHVA